MLFQIGRLIGYAALGAIAAESIHALGWLAEETTVFHPLWSMLHIAAVLWGLWLIWRAEQPLWLSRTAQQIWQRVSGRAAMVGGHSLSPLWLGMAWTFLPCGLLYSALLVAMFTAGALQGAMVMAAFAVGGGLMLTVIPWLWSRFLIGVRFQLINWNLTPINLGARLSGLVLAVTAGWGLYTGLTHSASPWCLPV
jgi:sulfite exporter TauE/SafE